MAGIRLQDKRYLPAGVSWLIFILFQTALFESRLFIYAIPVSVAVVVFGLSVLLKKSKNIEDAVNFHILPLLLLLSSYCFLAFLRNPFAKQFICITTSILIYYYLRSLFYFFFRPSAYKTYVIENISSYANLIAFFYFTSFLYGLQAFLDISVGILLVALAVFAYLVFYQIFWAHKIENKERIAYGAAGSFILTEIFWSVSFLPLRYLVSGALLSIAYYILFGLMKHYFADLLDRTTIKIYLGIGFCCALVILLTAQWI